MGFNFNECIIFMNNEEFDENDLSNFILPESFYNNCLTSGSTDGNRGFLLVFVNQDGS